jgi:hypothetical protein
MWLWSNSACTSARPRPGPTTWSDDLVENRLHLLRQVLLVCPLAIAKDAGQGIVAVGAVGEQPPAFVDDRDAARLQTFDGGGDQMANRAHLAGAEGAGHLQDDRGRRFGGVALEQCPLGQDEVDPRRRHPVDGLDRAGELAFDRSQAVDILEEARRRQPV